MVILLALAAFVAARQQPRFVYAVPAADARVTRDVHFASDNRLMDVYRPKPSAQSRTAPALVLFSIAASAQRQQPWLSGWATAAASNGIVALVADFRSDRAADDLDALLAYIAGHARELGIDANAVTVFAGSGNVRTAFPLVEDPGRPQVRAAVMLYGSAPVGSFRQDLPVLYVRAGLDRPDVNEAIGALAAKAIAQNAPITLLNHASGHHSFELTDDDAATRAVIQEVLAFVKRATAAPYRDALHDAQREVAAAGAFATGDYAAAVAGFGGLVAERPADARLRLSLGESLLANGQYREACAEFEHAKGRGLGARDLGIPAARACALSGSANAAIAWLQTIPARFLPLELERDPAFASVRDRTDFRSLFRR